MNSPQFKDDYMLERFSKSPEEFEAFYDQELKQIVKELEAERMKLVDPFKKLVKKYWIPALIVAIVIAIIDFSFFWSFSWSLCSRSNG